MADEQIDKPSKARKEWADLGRFRKLWNGGEHRLAYELANDAKLSEDDWAVLHGEFPEILDIINEN